MSASQVVKLCGMRTESDIHKVNQVVATFGVNSVDYVGFICVPSRKRFVMPAQIRHLRTILSSHVGTVGVFQDAPIANITELVSCGAIDVVQLHGSESEEYVSQAAQGPERFRGCEDCTSLWNSFRRRYR